jgi:hypothetical protein
MGAVNVLGMSSRGWLKWSKSPNYRSPQGWDRGLEAFLEPGEHVKHAFQATSGHRGTRWLGIDSSRPNQAWGGPIPLPPVAFALGVRNYVVAVTDRAVVIIRTSLSMGYPKEQVARLPRATRLGPFVGNGVITVGGIEMYVWEVADLQAVQDADGEIGYDCPAPPSLW